MNRARSWLLAPALVGAVGCGWFSPAPAASPGLARREPPPEPSADPTTRPAILAAHCSRVDDPELDGLDSILVVFNVEVDAAALDPRVFVVSRATRGPVRPQRALLAPANEDDENRSVLLIGDFGEATDEGQPTHVAVGGPLFSEDGNRLTGLGAAIEPFAAPPRVLAATMLPSGPGRCEGHPTRLRTYWSDELRGVEPEDRARVRLRAKDGTTHHPVAFDDHASDYAEAGQDNVLDLCIAVSTPILQILMEAGVFQDPAGHDNSMIELRMDDPTRRP
ncbi:MAG: hypothetical protein AAF799_43225 [Myxococcota bacterium]